MIVHMLQSFNIVQELYVTIHMLQKFCIVQKLFVIIHMVQSFNIVELCMTVHMALKVLTSLNCL